MTVTIHTGDVIAGLAKIESGTVQTCVTSPPYWGLRDYGTAKWEGGDAACDHKVNVASRSSRPSSGLTGGKDTIDAATIRKGDCPCGAVRIDNQIGLESSPDEFVAKMVAVFREVRRCLRDDGTLWLNLGDSYAGGGRGSYGDDGSKQSTNAGSTAEVSKAKHLRCPDGIKPKDLCMIPWRVALALQADGWWLRSVIVWAKKSPMPESVTDRPTSSWEPIFLLAKSERYYYDAEAVKEQGVPSGWNRQRELGSGAGCKINGVSHDSSVTMRNDADRILEATTTRNQRNVWHLGPEPFTGWIETSRLVPVEVGAVGDDIQRTPSADCPVHGCRDSRQGDEREACSQIHNHGIGSRRVTTQSCEQESSLQNHGSRCPVCSSDSQCLSCSMIATHHSTQTHKTGHDSATTPTCMLSAQTGIGTCDTGEQHAICDSADRTTESSTEAGCVQGASGSCLSGQTISGSEGKCTCKYHRLVTKKIDHFATFPTEIPRRCIMAGSKPGDLVLDPFLGSGTTLAVAAQLGRNGVGCELNPEYVKLAQDRIGRATRPNTYQSDKAVDAPLFGANHG